MKISIGSDHAGFKYKEEIKKYLESKGHEVIDCGTNSLESAITQSLVEPLPN